MNREISPSSLEQLAACPLAWFYRYGLNLRAPDDPEYDRERWLNDMQRGSLLHEVYEGFTRLYQGRQDEIHSDGAATALLEITNISIERWRVVQPPPGVSVFDGEVDALRRNALVFLEMEREHARRDSAQWRDFELKFGGGGIPATFELAPGRAIAVKGMIDRVDVLPDGGLRIIDYKTGKSNRFRKNPKAGAFNGGRQLQAAVYATVSTSVFGAPVTSFEYRFPTENGRGDVIAYNRAELDAAEEIVAGLLRHVEDGSFVPTDDESDCTYCEYGPICRVKASVRSTHSPRAKWAADNGENLEVYAIMRELRSASAATEKSDE
jgi:ATP-dependent helicase/nuclease subunit B